MAQVRHVFRAVAKAYETAETRRPEKRKGTLKELEGMMGAAGGRVIDLRDARARRGA